MIYSASTMLLTMSSLFTFLSLLLTHMNLSYIAEWEICNIYSSNLNLNIMMEWSSILYCSIIMFISSMVMEFSKKYMKTDKSKNRFWALIMLFIMSMLLLILIPNMLTLLIGWDGLGITSFLLIMYYNNPQSMSASMFTMLMNRLGDMFLLMAIITSLSNSNWLPHNNMQTNMMAQSLGIMTAAMTKSAQMPYSSWLPAAMAAPTPVSALVHSSTLVTAGIFLLYRFNFLISYSTLLQSTLTMSGLFTMLIAALSAMYEKDMKKIIALSTLSQLGLMTFCLGLKMYNLAFFHMMTHAIFKALLFICAGTLISSNSHNQDMRLYGMYLHTQPLVTSSFFISSMTMIGMPFLAGYYSKHTIMEWSTMLTMNIFIYLLLLISIMFTSLYTMKLMTFIIITPPMHKPLFTSNTSKNNTNPLYLMSVTSICMSPILQWSLPITINSAPMTENFQSSMINTITLFSILSIMLFMLLHTSNNNKPHMLHMLLYSLSFMLPLSTKFFTFSYLTLSFHLYKTLDQAWLEKISSMSTMPLFYNTSMYFNKPMNFMPQKTLLATTMLSIISLVTYSM